MESISKSAEQLGYPCLSAEQQEAGRGQFCSGARRVYFLPTGVGTSLCYLVLPSIFNLLRNSNAPINVTPHHPQHGARWGNVGICACVFYNAPGVGERLACKSPTYPHLAPTGDHSPNREHYATCPYVRIRMKIRSCQMPHPWDSKQLANPHVIPTLPRVGGGGA